jgi:hypothetical protein
VQKVVTIGGLGDVGDDDAPDSSAPDSDDVGAAPDSDASPDSSGDASPDSSGGGDTSGASSGGLALFQRSTVALAATGALVVAFVVARLVKDR